MSRFVVDATIVAKWLVPEADSERARALLDSDHLLLAPDLLAAEVGNILWKKRRLGELGHDESLAALELFRDVPVRMLDSGSFLDAAFTIAARHDRTVYDSLHLAIAIAVEAPMVTADRKLVRTLASTGLAPSMLSIDALAPTG